jgi:hypothetical protein
MKDYITPEMEITEFDTEDVILTSIPTQAQDNEYQWGPIFG